MNVLFIDSIPFDMMERNKTRNITEILSVLSKLCVNSSLQIPVLIKLDALVPPLNIPRIFSYPDK